MKQDLHKCSVLSAFAGKMFVSIMQLFDFAVVAHIASSIVC